MLGWSYCKFREWLLWDRKSMLPPRSSTVHTVTLTWIETWMVHWTLCSWISRKLAIQCTSSEGLEATPLHPLGCLQNHGCSSIDFEKRYRKWWGIEQETWPLSIAVPGELAGLQLTHRYVSCDWDFSLYGVLPCEFGTIVSLHFPNTYLQLCFHPWIWPKMGSPVTRT